MQILISQAQKIGREYFFAITACNILHTIEFSGITAALKLVS